MLEIRGWIDFARLEVAKACNYNTWDDARAACSRNTWKWEEINQVARNMFHLERNNDWKDISVGTFSILSEKIHCLVTSRNSTELDKHIQQLETLVGLDRRLKVNLRRIVEELLNVKENNNLTHFER